MAEFGNNSREKCKNPAVISLSSPSPSFQPGFYGRNQSRGPGWEVCAGTGKGGIKPPGMAETRKFHSTGEEIGGNLDFACKSSRWCWDLGFSNSQSCPSVPGSVVPSLTCWLHLCSWGMGNKCRQPARGWIQRLWAWIFHLLQPQNQPGLGSSHGSSSGVTNRDTPLSPAPLEGPWGFWGGMNGNVHLEPGMLQELGLEQ